MTEYWVWPQTFVVRWGLIERGEAFALAERLYTDVRFMLRILFAVNHLWEPDWKWLRYETERLSIKPERLFERINTIFSLPQTEQTVAEYLLLLRDALRGVPARYDVARALATVEESLRLHGF